MRKILILGGSCGSMEIIKYSKSIGYHTIITDYISPSISKAKQAADEYWMISTANVDELEQKCREEDINAIICGASEFNIEICMELCKRLELPNYCTPEAWHFSRDKADFKLVCKRVGAPIPEDYYVTDKMDDSQLNAIKFPVMVKPVDLAGNRGISYCYNKEDLVKAYRYARSLSKSNKIIVERMLHGKEWWAGYALAEGEARLLSLNGMYAQPGEPANCYTLTSTISDNIEKFIMEINPKIEEVLKAVGCKEGFAWVQIMLDEDGHFYIIEMGYRLSGEGIFIPLTNLIKFDTIKWLVDYSCGKKHTKEDLPSPQITAYTGSANAMHLWTNKEGTITQITGWDVIQKNNKIKAENFSNVGDYLGKYRPFGNVLFTTDDINETCDLINFINNTVHVLNEDGEDMIIKYTNFDYLKKVYQDGIDGK